jgi:hypothetical protein
MKNRIILSFIFMHSYTLFAQDNQTDVKNQLVTLSNKVNSLHISSSNLKSEVIKLSSELSEANSCIDSLKNQMEINNSAIFKTADELGIKIKETGEKNEGKITEVSNSLSKNSLYSIIGVLSAILLSVLGYWILSKRQQTDKTDFIDQLSKTKSSIEESLVKEFGKQTELMDAQLHLIEQQKTNLQSTPNTEHDHSLALKVASEITLIERNLGFMDPGTRGLKQLARSVDKLKENLAANGYEIPDLLGKAFNEGMKVIVINSLPDETLEKGIEKITKILVPQVIYEGVMIQTAQIEVSIGI